MFDHAPSFTRIAEREMNAEGDDIFEERRRAAAFTLVEVLVGIGIVAILVALSLGGLKTVKASANGARCLANLRQIGSGAASFFQERNGALFPDKFFYTASFESDGGLRDYVGLDFPEKTSKTPPEYYRDSIFTCPEFKMRHREKFNPPTLFNRTYTLNEYALAAEDGVPKSASYPGRLSRILSLSEMAMIMDGSSSSVSIHTTLNPSYVTRNFLSYPHGKAQSVLFFDGHVALVTEADIRQPKNPRKFWGNLDLPES